MIYTLKLLSFLVVGMFAKAGLKNILVRNNLGAPDTMGLVAAIVVLIPLLFMFLN